MELLQLRYFLTTAEYQHMTKAAEHLQIAQPALSQAIHRLESELGIPLFERKNRSIELNDAGRLLQKRLIPIISALDRIPGELKAGQYLSSHTIHLKLLAASTLITNRIIAYRTLRPDVNFQLYQSDTNADFDLCVSAIRSDIKSEEDSDYMVMLEEDPLTKPLIQGTLSLAIFVSRLRLQRYDIFFNLQIFCYFFLTFSAFFSQPYFGLFCIDFMAQSELQHSHGLLLFFMRLKY